VPEVRTIERPPIVHQYKVGDGKKVTTKCGITARKKDTPTTAWGSEVTCEECNP
jgi:hypothetical protein